jgi:hypothetical protein
MKNELPRKVEALERFGIAVEPELVRTGGWWQDDGYEHALGFLS